MSDFNYSLERASYTLKNALLWGNCWGHFQKVATGNLGKRIVHLLIAIVELPPIIGQIASLFERYIIFAYSSHSPQGLGHLQPLSDVVLDRRQFIEEDEQKISEEDEEKESISNRLKYSSVVGDLSELGDLEIPFNTDLLCHYLADLPLDLKLKFLVLSLDRLGFGDFVFGMNVLEMIQRQFPRAEGALATDSPDRAEQVNHRKYRILRPEAVGNNIPLNQIVSVMKAYKPDFLIVAPVTSFDREPLKKLGPIPHLFLREYGITERTLSKEGEEYISGAGEDYKGIIVHRELVDWAKSRESLDVLKRLSHLRFLSEPRIIQAILGAAYSDLAIEHFNRENELFFGYSAYPESKREFIFSVADMFYNYLRSKKNLCFFFMGRADHTLLTLLENYHSQLKAFGISQIEFIDPNQGKKTVDLDSSKGRILKIVWAFLPSSDVIHMLKASEKETLSTGDQFLSETISAGKHWIQENMLHKRDALKSMIELSKKIPSFSRGESELFSLLSRALRPVALGQCQKKPLERSPAQAKLLFKARTDPKVAKDWLAMNQLITSEHILEPWLIGMIKKKILEQNPIFKQRFEGIVNHKQIPASTIVQLLLDCYDRGNIRSR